MRKGKLFERLEDKVYRSIKDKENIGMLLGWGISFAGIIIKNNYVANLGAAIFGTSAGYTLYKLDTEDELF